MFITRISRIKIPISVIQSRCISVESKSNSFDYGSVLLQKLDGDDKGIAVYSLNAPKDRNALGNGMVKSMREVHQVLREDLKLSVVILRSLVPKIFCAGANLKERFQMKDEEVLKFVHGLRATLTEIEDLPMPTIVALEGVAVGGGLEMALACDIRVAADSARMGLVETSRGLLPGAGGTQRLPRVVNLNVAKELIFTSRIVTGTEAKDLGIVNHVVKQNSNGDAAYLKALDLAREILPNAPIALRCAKQAVNEGVQLPIKEGYDVEQKYYTLNVPTRDRQEGMLSFIEKRKPVYKGE